MIKLIKIAKNYNKIKNRYESNNRFTPLDAFFLLTDLYYELTEYKPKNSETLLINRLLSNEIFEERERIYNIIKKEQN